MSDHVELRPAPERGSAPVADAVETLPCLGGVGEVYDAMGGRLPVGPAMGPSRAHTAGTLKKAG